MSSGVKNDEGKPKWHLLPSEEIEEVVQVLTHGASKYPTEDNWKRVPNWRDRYFSAAMRHLWAWRKGETHDSETKRSHLAHAICCLLFCMWRESHKDVVSE